MKARQAAKILKIKHTLLFETSLKTKNSPWEQPLMTHNEKRSSAILEGQIALFTGGIYGAVHTIRLFI